MFQAAIDACRARTREHLLLPADERFSVEYVTGKSWSGYNWFQGGATSLIQVNTDLPIYIDRAIDLAAPRRLSRAPRLQRAARAAPRARRGWLEFSVYALFSPQSLIAEGTANFGIDVAFPGPTRRRSSAIALFPLAGLDPRAPRITTTRSPLTERLAYAGNEAARRYLDGEISRADAAAWLETYALQPRARAEQRVRFFDQYRSYVINYNLGKDLVRAYIEAPRRHRRPPRPALGRVRRSPVLSAAAVRPGVVALPRVAEGGHYKGGTYRAGTTKACAGTAPPRCQAFC